VVFSHQSCVHFSVLLVCLDLCLLTLETSFFKHCFSLPVLSYHALKELVLAGVVAATKVSEVSIGLGYSKLFSEFMDGFFVFSFTIKNR